MYVQVFIYIYIYISIYQAFNFFGWPLMALFFFPSTSGSFSLEAGFFGPYVRIYNYTHKNKHNIYIYYVFMNYRTV